jgi:hypothetical protein
MPQPASSFDGVLDSSNVKLNLLTISPLCEHNTTYTAYAVAINIVLVYISKKQHRYISRMYVSVTQDACTTVLTVLVFEI